MRWTPGGPSSDLEDRRGSSGGFGGGGMRIGLGGAAVLLVLSLVFKQNFFALLGGGGGGGRGADGAGPVASTPEEDKKVQFVSFVLDDAQGTWEQSCSGSAASPTSTPSWCCSATPSSRPAASPRRRPARSTVPGDEKVYIDLGFYDELQQRFGAPGDFAQAYVLAHELGHHVQRLLGTEAQVREAQQQRPDARQRAVGRAWSCRPTATPASGATRPQQRQILEPGDVEEGLAAAAAVGDDRIQRMSGQGVHPEAFTHGSSEQRASLVPARVRVRPARGLRHLQELIRCPSLRCCSTTAPAGSARRACSWSCGTTGGGRCASPRCRARSAADPSGRHPELEGVDSVVWVEPGAERGTGRVLVRSDAALRVARYLGGWWHLACVGAGSSAVGPGRGVRSHRPPPAPPDG